MKRLMMSCLGLMTWLGLAWPAPAASASMEQRFADLKAVERTSAEVPDTQARVEMIQRAYTRDFAPEQSAQRIRQRSDSDLRLLFRAARDLAYYSLADADAQAMALDVQAMESRHIVQDTDYLDLYRAYLGARRLSAARVLAKRHPIQGMERLPVMQGTGTGSWAWRVDPHAYALQATPVDLRGLHIMIVAHPLCHFSLNAARALAADQQLGPLFERYGLWLAPAAQSFDIALFQGWNKDHPKQPMLLTNRRQDWPMLKRWATPIFYFIKDGRVLAEVQGWPPEGNRQQLIQAIRRIGFPRRAKPLSGA